METAFIEVDSPDKYLTDVLKEIPTNVILYKTLTGLGATYSELKANRHSIIIEPNVPVITGKCKSPKHEADNLLGVCEGVTIDKIVKYLQSSKDKHYKILTTPESFPKVKEAFQEIRISMYNTCFCLIDEAHKAVKDVDYRTDIVLPMDDFFKFKGKALVSATPIKFSDPRFEERQFKILKINPTFDYVREIDVKPCNNIAMEFKEEVAWLPFINEQNGARPYCIFVNSIDIIYSLITQLDLLDKSSVFCAPKSVDKLKQNKFTECYEDWSEEKMKQFNFFTSRFFNAVDVELDVKPYLIMITDVYFAEQTMLDPYSDVIQIIGRFRNGVTSISHITNTKHELPQRTEEEIKNFIQTSEDVYNTLQTFYDAAPNKGAREAYKAAMDSLPFNKMLDRDGHKNWFAIDNYMNDALVTGYYHDAQSLQKAYLAYKETFDSSVFVAAYHPVTDESMRLTRELKTLSIKEKRKQIVNLLDLLSNNPTQKEHEFKQELIKTDSFIVEAYEMLGRDTIEELNYSYSEIKERMIVAQFLIGAKGTETVQLIKNSFKVGMKYRLTDIKKELIRIFKLLRVTPPNKITAQSINLYFNTKEVWIKKDKALLLVSEKV